LKLADILEAVKRYLRLAIRILWNGLRAISSGVARVIRWWWNTFLTNPLAGLVVLLFALTFGTLGLAWVVRLADPQHAIVVSPFELPAGPSASLGVTGRAIAQGLTDDLQAIAREGGSVARTGLGGSAGGGETSEIRIPPRDVSTVGVKVAWFSFSTDGILAGWYQFRRRVRRISGEAIMESDGLTLRARAGQIGPWESGKHSASKPGLDSATFELASRSLSRLYPEMIGNYYWGQNEFEKATEVYRAWLDREPSRVEPRFYLAVSLQLSGQPREAIVQYNKALEIDTTVSLLLNVGSAHLNVGEYAEADLAFERALAHGPDEIEADLILQNADDLERLRRGVAERAQAFARDTASAATSADSQP